MFLPESYLDIDILQKEKALLVEAAQYLKDLLPDSIFNILSEYFLYNNKENSNLLTEYFCNNSNIFNAINSTPGSSLGYDCLYTKKIKTQLDKYFITCTSGHQIYERLKALELNLPTVVRSHQSYVKSLFVDNVGSGVGRDMLNVIHQNPDLRDRVHVRQIDPDVAALDYSRKIALDLHVIDNFSFYEKTLSDVEPKKSDVVLLIGMLCPLSLRYSEYVLRKLKRLCNDENGIVVFSTATHNMVIDDPLTDALMRLSGWNMSFKTEEESMMLAASVGWKILDLFYDEPHHHHCMVVAQL